MSHLRQAKNPRCRETLQELEEHPQRLAANFTEHSHHEPLDDYDNDNDNDRPASPPQIFTGDFFGERYGPADLPGWEFGEFDEAFDEGMDDAELSDR